MNTKTLLQNLISWRLILVVFAVIGLRLLPFSDSFPYREALLEPFGHPLLYSWASFDGVHYLGIARSGYFADFTQAFFPFYPLLIHWVDIFINNYLFSGLLISHLSLAIALYYLYKLIRLDFTAKVAYRSIVLLLLFPTSFYFGSLYTESLFLALTVSSFYYMRKKNSAKAITLAALASATRVIGIFLLPALILEKYDQLKTKKQKKQIKHYLPFLLSGSGLVAYMYFLQKNFSDALYFLNAQPAFGAGRSSDKLILLYQVMFRYTKMLLTVEPLSILYYTVTQEFFFSVLFLFLIILAFKKVRTSYFLFALLSYIAPTLTGTFSSMPRYVLMLFPCFMVVSLTKNQKLYRLWLIVSVILLAINTILFTRGYWVA